MISRLYFFLYLSILYLRMHSGWELIDEAYLSVRFLDLSRKDWAWTDKCYGWVWQPGASHIHWWPAKILEFHLWTWSPQSTCHTHNSSRRYYLILRCQSQAGCGIRSPPCSWSPCHWSCSSILSACFHLMPDGSVSSSRTPLLCRSCWVRQIILEIGIHRGISAMILTTRKFSG